MRVKIGRIHSRHGLSSKILWQLVVLVVTVTVLVFRHLRCPSCEKLSASATRKTLTRGRTIHFSNILADHEFSACCYLFTVSNSGLLFSHGQHSQQLLSSCFSHRLSIWLRRCQLEPACQISRSKVISRLSHSKGDIVRTRIHITMDRLLNTWTIKLVLNK